MCPLWDNGNKPVSRHGTTIHSTLPFGREGGGGVWGGGAKGQTSSAQVDCELRRDNLLLLGAKAVPSVNTVSCIVLAPPSASSDKITTLIKPLSLSCCWHKK